MRQSLRWVRRSRPDETQMNGYCFLIEDLEGQVRRETWLDAPSSLRPEPADHAYSPRLSNCVYCPENNHGAGGPKRPAIEGEGRAMPSGDRSLGEDDRRAC
jgi:hypothetical protein